MFGTQQSWPDGTDCGARAGNGSRPNQTSDGRTPIIALSAGQNEAIVVGIVLTKQTVKSFMDKKNPGSERCCFTFTMRDSAEDYINVTCWGSAHFIMNLAKQFKLTDVVEVRNPQVVSKSSNPNDEKWKPTTPGPFQLSVNENHGSVSLYSGWNLAEFSAFAHVPISNISDYYTLGDIILAGDRVSQQHVNILAAVKSVNPAREITTRNGQQLKCRDIVLFDSTVPSFLFTVWNEDLVELADTWTPHENVLFITSTKVSMNTYRNEMTASSGAKTIVLTNPDTVDAHDLYQFAQSQELTSSSNTGDTPVAAISDEEFTLQDIIEATDSKKRLSGHLSAAVIAANIDDDGDQTSCICRRCTSCKSKVKFPDGGCRSASCHGSAHPTELEFNIQVTLADVTGSMERCYFMPGIAEAFLGCTAEEFLQMKPASKTGLKWKFLLERVELAFVASPPTDRFSMATCRIASIELARCS